eukprot:1651959-Prymnesium_polylepis.2
MIEPAAAPASPCVGPSSEPPALYAASGACSRLSFLGARKEGRPVSSPSSSTFAFSCSAVPKPLPPAPSRRMTAGPALGSKRRPRYALSAASVAPQASRPRAQYRRISGESDCAVRAAAPCAELQQSRGPLPANRRSRCPNPGQCRHAPLPRPSRLATMRKGVPQRSQEASTAAPSAASAPRAPAVAAPSTRPPASAMPPPASAMRPPGARVSRHDAVRDRGCTAATSRAARRPSPAQARQHAWRGRAGPRCDRPTVAQAAQVMRAPATTRPWPSAYGRCAQAAWPCAAPASRATTPSLPGGTAPSQPPCWAYHRAARTGG